MCVCGVCLCVCVFVCVIYISPARPKCGHMDYGGRLEDDPYRASSIYVYRWPFFFFFFYSMVVLYNT